MYPTRMKTASGTRDPFRTPVGGKNNGTGVVGNNNHKLEAPGLGKMGLEPSNVYAQSQQPYIPHPGKPSAMMFYTNNANQIVGGRLTQSQINNRSAIDRRDRFGSARY